MKKKFSVAQLLAILLPALVLAMVLTAQLCYRFMLMPAKERHNKEMLALSEKYNPEGKNFPVKFKEIYEYIAKNYVGQWDEEQLQTTLLKTLMTLTGDRYSAYYTKEEYAELLADYSGEAVGVGMRVICPEEGQFLIYHVEPGSPAEKAGLKAGDRITAIAGEDISALGYTEAMDRLVGKEGTEAAFTVLRDGSAHEVSITRAKITVSTVSYSMEENNVGYIRIMAFQSNTYAEFKKAVDALTEQGATALVFDLRNNGGGLLNSVINVLDYLIEDKEEEEEKSRLLVTTVDAAKNEKRYRCGDEHGVNLPMAVLINGNTASAAELFTAALRDYDLAVTVGENSYGKGVAQVTYSLSDGTALKLTTSFYNPPCGENYDGKGIAPDIPAAGDTLDYYLSAPGEDPVYLKAAELLCGN